MSIDGDEGRLEVYLQELVDLGARYSLGVTGDAIDVRVESCLAEAEQLLALNHPGPALSLAATAGELIIRFLVVRPLVQGAFHSEEWASILADRIWTGRSSGDRELLPNVLQQWRIDISTFKTGSGLHVWDFMRNTLWPQRDYFVHRGDRPTNDTARSAIEVVRFLRNVIVDQVASSLGFTLKETGKWCEIKRKDALGGKQFPQQFEPWDPILGKKFVP